MCVPWVRGRPGHAVRACTKVLTPLGALHADIASLATDLGVPSLTDPISVKGLQIPADSRFDDHSAT